VTLIAIALVVAVGLIVGLYALQDRMLFFPQPLVGAGPSSHRVEPVEVVAEDGTSLRGWLVKAERAPAPLLVYFGGNAEEVSWLASPGHHPWDWSLLLVNYRGYGQSGGRPSEARLFADALRLYDWAAARPDVDARRIASLGRSLGSGVAIYLATKRPLVGLVLVTPLDSVTAVAQHHYPFLPVRWLLRHPFDSLSRATTISVPVLMLVAGRDTVVPPVHAERLYERWRAPKQWIMFPDADHESIAAEPGYGRAIAAFLNDRG
jgi:fermentation-respiration switch protein FrsA (DUF1100 family)